MVDPAMEQSTTRSSGTDDRTSPGADQRDVVEALGIIAGKGNYPLILARAARAQGVKRIFAVAFKGETDKQINQLCDEVHWQYVGQLADFVRAFGESGIHVAVMAGQITPKNIFHVRLDKAMREMLGALPQKNADTIFGAIGDRLNEVGVKLQPASLFMESEMPTPGLLTARAPSEDEQADIELGLQVAKATSGINIGQTVVIKGGVILAVEAFEGTDAAILRGGKLGGAGSVVVKVARRGHDMRWDIPVVGLRTLRKIRKAKATVLAMEAGRTILLEREAVLAEAKRMGLTMIAIDLNTLPKPNPSSS